jgi:hypothetical protein
MDKLIIEPTLNSPRVVLDPAENRFEFSGESRPENVRSFYLPVLEWLESFSGTASGTYSFVFDFEYFNSTSAKYILDVFKILHGIQERGSQVQVKWHYEEDDEDMYEVGLEMSRMSGLDFEYVKEEV